MRQLTASVSSPADAWLCVDAHTGAFERGLHIHFWRAGQWLRLFVFKCSLEGIHQNGARLSFLLNTRCQLGVLQLNLVYSSRAFSPQPFVLGAVEPQQPVVLFMRACLNQSASSAYPINRR